MSFDKAKKRALSLLSYSSRTRKEIAFKLKEAGFGDDIIEETILCMEDYGYIDDEKYAKEYVRAAAESKGHGRYRIFQDLLNRGIERETVVEVVTGYYEDADEDAELSNAIKLLSKKLKGREEREIRRSYAFLMRRGFSIDIIKSAFKAVGESIHEEYNK